MSQSKRDLLIEQGPEALADALLELAERDEAASDMVVRLTATPDEKVKRFKSKLAGIKRARRFVPWRESAELAGQLERLLAELTSAVDDPCQGAELVGTFYTTDGGTLGRCDDSSGHVGDVYRYDALELFVRYAGRCEDKKALARQVLKLVRKDDYGVRGVLVDAATEYLPESVIRETMIPKLKKWAEAEAKTDEFAAGHYYRQVESLAHQLRDAPLFEKMRRASWRELNSAACVDIARVYFLSGDVDTALGWIERIPQGDTFRARERDELLLEIHGRTGNQRLREEAAWRLFRRERSEQALDKLLAVIGAERRSEVLIGEVEAIMADLTLRLSDVGFLIDTGHVEQAENYLLGRADQLNGRFYDFLLSLAKTLESKGRPLGATLVYRALLDSILERASTKTYGHGARYLKKLDSLADAVGHWRDLQDHAAYKAHLYDTHGRKRSFWAHYEA